MSSVDQKIAASALATESGNQAMDLRMCKIGDVTHFTLVADASAQRGFMRAFGTNDGDFFNGLLHQVANAGSKGKCPDELGTKMMLAFIKSVEPRDEIEAALCAQMAASHVATMRFANRLAHAETLQDQDSAERTYNRLARTFATQVEALQRYRAGSAQKVTVQNVSVNRGGQAVVGNVTQSAHQAALKKRARVMPVLADARQPSMEMIGELERQSVPLRRRQNHDG
jgi:hypothetical protein